MEDNKDVRKREHRQVSKEDGKMGGGKEEGGICLNRR